MGWQNGRQLVSASSGSNTLSYTYDANGLRASKTVNGVEHSYVYNGAQLILESYGTTRLEFLYDASGAPYAVRHSTNSGSSWTTYYYILNLQGDVVALMNTSGSIVAKYTYDAWGKVTAVTNGSGTAITDSANIANTSPIRYRGYYYDTESSLYYLQSRYYDPEAGRFLNADSYASTGQGVIGFNMFAYCGNNPMSYCDPNGNTFIRSGYKQFSSGLIAYTDTGSGCMIQTSISAQVFQPYDKFAGYAEKHCDYYHYAMYAGVNGPNLSEGAILAAAAAGLGVIGADYEHSSWQIETVTADAKIGASLDYIGFQAGARLVSGEAGLKFPLPFTDRELYVGLEGELFGVGAYSYVQDGKLRIGVTLLVGGGVIIGISDE